MDSKDMNNGTLKTVYRMRAVVRNFPQSNRLPKVPINQRELEKLRQQLLEKEQKVKHQEELLLQYATSTPIRPTVTDPTLTPRVPRQKEQEETMKTDPTAGPNPEILLTVLQNLANIVIDNKNATKSPNHPSYPAVSRTGTPGINSFAPT